MPTTCITRHLRVVAVMSDPNLHFCDRDSKPKFVCTYFIHIGMCVCVEGGHCNGNMFYHPDSKVLPVY